MKKLKLLKKIKNFFLGSNIGEKIYDTPSQVRENRLIYRLFEDGHFWGLCNDSFKWVAVGIPFDIIDSKEKGDIDILFCIPKNLGKNSKYFYRAFEVKASLIDKNGKARSLKRGNKKFEIKKQLEKLKKFGAEQVFLLEILLLHSEYKGNFFTKEVIESLKEKRKYLANIQVGYVVMPLKYFSHIPENEAGRYGVPDNILLAPFHKVSQSFIQLVEHIDKFYESSTEVNTWKIITYCKKCKNLTIVSSSGPLKCFYCGESVL